MENSVKYETSQMTKRVLRTTYNKPDLIHPLAYTSPRYSDANTPQRHLP